MDSSEQQLILIVVVCFFLGYGIVSLIFRGRNSNVPSSDGPPRNGGTEGRFPNKSDFASMENYYRHMLGVSDHVGEADLKSAYGRALARYHPDTVEHLGAEFQDLAARRTKEIIEAYEYLRTVHGFR
jgi:DnaJ-like protein